jgi:phage-related minor tail protein
MAGGSIKGITISFAGDTTKLDKALRQINTETRSLDKELKQVDNALKFNPTNIELWRQKQELLTQKVDDTKTKLDVLKDAQAKLDAEGVDKNSKEYRELERQIIVTGNQVKTFEGQLKKVGNYKLKALSEQFKEVGGKLESAGESLKPLSTAGAAAATSIGALAYKGGVAADDLNTLSKVTGIGTKDLQKYSVAADLVDVSVEAIAKSNKKLTKNAYAAANGSKSQAEAFAALGISVTDSNGDLKDSEVLFQEVIGALGTMTNESERDALAQKLMGGAAQELNPLIADGGETYKQVAGIIAQYDLDFVDQETLDGASQFNDSLDTMKVLGQTALSQVSTQLASYLAPALEKVVGWVGKFAKWLGNLDPKVLTVVAGIGAALAVLAPLLITLGKLATGISSIINLVNIVGPAIGGLSIAGGPLLAIVAAIAAVVAAGILLYKNWDKIKATAQKVGAAVKKAWTDLKTSISTTLDNIKTKFTTTWDTIKTTVTGTVRKMKESVENTIASLRDWIDGRWEYIKKSTSYWWDTIKEKITAPFTKAKETIEGIVEKIKNLFPIDLSDFFGNIKLPHFSWTWSEVTDGISIPNINVDWYDKGGIFDRPSVIGVGEKRPEFVGALDDLRSIVREESGGLGEITINVYGTPGMDVNQLAQAVEQRLVMLQKQRQKAYGTI